MKFCNSKLHHVTMEICYYRTGSKISGMSEASEVITLVTVTDARCSVHTRKKSLKLGNVYSNEYLHTLHTIMNNVH